MKGLSIEANALVVILIFGSLLLLSFLLIANPLQVNRRANTWFGSTLMIWATFWIEEILDLSGLAPLTGIPLLTLLFVQFFAPVIFYKSVVLFTNPEQPFGRRDLLMIILPLLYTVLLLFRHFGNPGPGNLLIPSGTILVILQVLVYTIASVVRIRRHQKKILEFSSNTSLIDLSWLEYIIYMVLGVSLITVLYNILLPDKALNLFMNLLFLLVIYGIAYFALRQVEIFPVKAVERIQVISLGDEERTPGQRRQLLRDEDMAVHKVKLENLMEQEEPYLDCELNLIRLAGRIGLNPHQLSFLINQGFGENFFQFINRYRVEKAKKLLLGGTRFSILGIAYEAGFSSKTAFNTTFKKFTGSTPSEFQRQGSGL